MVWRGVAGKLAWPLQSQEREYILKPNHDIELSHTEIRVDVVNDGRSDPLRGGCWKFLSHYSLMR